MPRVREGASAGRELDEWVALSLSGLCSGGSRGARSRSERRAAVGGGPGRGDWCWWVVEGVFGEGVALGTEAPPDSEFISLVIMKQAVLSKERAVRSKE